MDLLRSWFPQMQFYGVEEERRTLAYCIQQSKKRSHVHLPFSGNHFCLALPLAFSPRRAQRRGLWPTCPFYTLLSGKGSSKIPALAAYCSGNYFGAKRMRIFFPHLPSEALSRWTKMKEHHVELTCLQLILFSFLFIKTHFFREASSRNKGMISNVYINLNIKGCWVPHDSSTYSWIAPSGPHAPYTELEASEVLVYCDFLGFLQKQKGSLNTFVHMIQQQLHRRHHKGHDTFLSFLRNYLFT